MDFVDARKTLNRLKSRISVSIARSAKSVANGDLKSAFLYDTDIREMSRERDDILKSFGPSICGGNISELATLHSNWVGEMGWHNKTPLEMIGLLAGEIGEAANECRGDKPTKKLGSELADICLRAMNMANVLGIDIQDEIVKKMEKNFERGNRGRKK